MESTYNINPRSQFGLRPHIFFSASGWLKNGPHVGIWRQNNIRQVTKQKRCPCQIYFNWLHCLRRMLSRHPTSFIGHTAHNATNNCWSLISPVFVYATGTLTLAQGWRFSEVPYHQPPPSCYPSSTIPEMLYSFLQCWTR